VQDFEKIQRATMTVNQLFTTFYNSLRPMFTNFKLLVDTNANSSTFRNQSLAPVFRSLRKLDTKTFRQLLNMPNATVVFRQENAQCWKFIAKVRSSSLCETCSGNSKQYFEDRLALISPHMCEEVLAHCATSFDMTVDFVRVVGSLAESINRAWNLTSSHSLSALTEQAEEVQNTSKSGGHGAKRKVGRHRRGGRQGRRSGRLLRVKSYRARKTSHHRRGSRQHFSCNLADYSEEIHQFQLRRKAHHYSRCRVYKSTDKKPDSGAAHSPEAQSAQSTLHSNWRPNSQPDQNQTEAEGKTWAANSSLHKKWKEATEEEARELCGCSKKSAITLISRATLW
jgi:hypothetical protein